jgi:hypothetical protein
MAWSDTYPYMGRWIDQYIYIYILIQRIDRLDWIGLGWIGLDGMGWDKIDR